MSRTDVLLIGEQAPLPDRFSDTYGGTYLLGSGALFGPTPATPGD